MSTASGAFLRRLPPFGRQVRPSSPDSAAGRIRTRSRHELGSTRAWAETHVHHEGHRYATSYTHVRGDGNRFGPAPRTHRAGDGRRSGADRRARGRRAGGRRAGPRGRHPTERGVAVRDRGRRLAAAPSRGSCRVRRVGSRLPRRPCCRLGRRTGQGPLLLTNPAYLPGVVFDELQRLNPGRISLIGGLGAVGAGVQSTLNGIAPTTRLAGPDRYTTGLAIVRSAFTCLQPCGHRDRAHLPRRARRHRSSRCAKAPIVLVDGTRPTVSAATLTELKRLGVRSVSIAGGPGRRQRRHPVAAQVDRLHRDPLRRRHPLRHRGPHQPRVLPARLVEDHVPRHRSRFPRRHRRGSAGRADGRADQRDSSRLHPPIGE